MGVYELGVTEALFRLTDPGDMAIDVGANIGYMTSILARVVAENGTVFAIEPHPALFRELNDNVARWTTQSGVGKIRCFEGALSSRSGMGTLCIPTSFCENTGTASIARNEVGDNSSHSMESGKRIQVKLHTLESLLASHLGRVSIGIMKIDVEGHELEVLKGAENWLVQKRIRDIVFEDHGDYPTSTTTYLADRGYQVFRITKSFFGPRLTLPAEPHTRIAWEPPSFLATHAPARAIARFKTWGWQLLNSY
jgi:FkbM family methyltransferase